MGGGGEEYHDFPSKTFCFAGPKIFAGEPFCAVLQKFPIVQKFMDKKGGRSIKVFRRKIFCLPSAENLGKGTFSCFTNSMYRNFFCFRGLCHVFRFSVEFFFVFTAEFFRR